MTFRERVARFMLGRYGSDRLSRALSYFTLALLVLAFIVKRAGAETAGALIWWLAFASVVWNIYRMFSRNATARRAELDKYLVLKAKLTGFFRRHTERARQAGAYRVFTCPGCSQRVRTPRGKGTIRITCPKCGVSFIRKS